MPQDAKWEDTPGILRESVEGALDFGGRMVDDYTQTVIEREIASRRYDKDDPEAWAKTVKTLVSVAINHGSMMRCAVELGMPGAKEKLDDLTKVVE